MAPPQTYLTWKAQVKANYRAPLLSQSTIKYRYFRFVPMEIRGDGNDWYVQLSQLHMKFQGKDLTAKSATNPGGNNPSNETPRQAIDGLIQTKWLDHNRCPLILDFGLPLQMDTYTWMTANDGPYRDPISWRLEGSNDGNSWDLLDTQENYSVPTARHSMLSDFIPAALRAAPPTPIPLPALHLATEANDLVKMQELLEQDNDANEITQDGIGRTAVFYARTKEAIALLVKFKAKLDIPETGPDHLTPLHRAVLRQSEEEILYLLAFGANINENPNNNGTPLHTAAYDLLEGSSTLLVECGADRNIRNKVNKIPTAFALDSIIQDPTKKQKVSQLIANTAVNTSRLEFARQEAQQLFSNLEPLQETVVTANGWDEFDQHILEALTYMSKSDWTKAKYEFENARSLLKTNLSDDPQTYGLSFHLLALYLICLKKLGISKDKIQAEYFQQIGIIQYLQPFSSALPFVSIIKPESLCSSKSSLLSKIREVHRPLYKTLFAPVFQELRAILKEYADNHAVTDKTFYAQLDDKKLGIPTSLEAMLAAHDAYERNKTSAKSAIADCPQYTPAATTPSLASMGWELLLTARESALYQDNQYFGKVYINHTKKLIMFANKGTDNYEDCRADFELFKRRLPLNYFKQANSLLTAVKDKLKAQEKEDFAIYATGHSLGGGITELLSCQHGIPGITWDSPGMWEVIEEDNRRQILAGNSVRFPIKNLRWVPVIGIISQRNLVNTTNRHVGRLLRIASGWFVMQKIAEAFNITTYTILMGLLKKVGAVTAEQLITTFISQATFDMVSKDVVAAYQELEHTFKTHLLEGCFLPFLTKAHDNYAPYVFEEVVKWPIGIQDGNTQPVGLSFRERCVHLSHFDADTQVLLKNAHLIRQRNDFPTQYQDFKNLLGAISITDKNGGFAHSLDYLTIKGKVSVDQFRLYLHNLSTLPQHQALQKYLKQVLKELTSPPAPVPAVSSIPPVTPSPVPATPSTTPGSAARPVTTPVIQPTTFVEKIDVWIQAHPYLTATGASGVTALVFSLLSMASTTSPPIPANNFGPGLK